MTLQPMQHCTRCGMLVLRRQPIYLLHGVALPAHRGLREKPRRHIGRVAITITLSPPDERSFNIDNRSKRLLDLLVAARVIEDDSCNSVRELTIRIKSILRAPIQSLRVTKHCIRRWQ